jgi:exodeoxyribonuclease V alpha subunit
MTSPTPNYSAGISSSKFAEIIERARAAKLAKLAPTSESTELEKLAYESAPDKTLTLSDIRAASLLVTTDKNGKEITYNSRQSEFVTLASTHNSCCLIGPAGTGKTTAMKGTVAALIQSPATGVLQNHDHKHLPNGVPGIVICAYTRRATNNIRKNMDEGMKGNCVTIHKLLEYGPVYDEYSDSEGNSKTKMNFEPARNSSNPLPRGITTIIFEESSMISLDLYGEVIAALSHTVQIIFLGDIQQLPPVFGPAILGFKLSEIPTVELTEVYRQALESPIIRLAHRILSGSPIKPAELPSWKVPGLNIIPWKKKIDSDSALEVMTKYFVKAYESGEYTPGEDMILIPFNKSFGTTEMNKSIANKIARSKSLVTWEIVAGFLKHYYTIGDKVLFDREDAVILDIYPNPAYTGAAAQPESVYLDYWGHNNSPRTGPTTNGNNSDVDIDFLLSQVSKDSEDRVTQASHHIKILLTDSDKERTITKAAEVNTLMLGYALTVHKSQGSEWEKVYILFHNSHATMMQRELLYTAVTRAKKDLVIVCEPETFVKGILSQRIKGNTLAEKAEYFKGKSINGDLMS